MTDDAGVLLFCTGLRVPVPGRGAAAQGRLAASSAVTSTVRAGERVLEIGAGLGLAAVLAARAGARVVATDVVPAAVEATRANAALNGVTIDARLGDCYAPVAGERFDLSPRIRRRCRRRPVASARDADGGGRQRRARRLGPARPDHRGRARAPRPGRPARVHDLRLPRASRRRSPAARPSGLAPACWPARSQAFPRIGYERLEHLRELDAEGTLPRGLPAAVERFVIEGRLRRDSA